MLTCVIRLLVWYTVITALFRCPSSPTELTDKSSPVCGPYLTARSYVSPFVQPYYNTYAAPYVDSAKPYVDRVNKQVYTPSVEFGTQKYQQYGAPRVEMAQKYGQVQWEKTLRPQLEAVQSRARKQYDSSLAPQLNKVSTTINPYYVSGRDQALDVYNQRLMPAYTASIPYIQRTYTTGHEIAMEVGLPYAQSAWNSSLAFFSRTLWPKLSILYGKNVEPQLARIRERLGRYRDGKKMHSVMEEAMR